MHVHPFSRLPVLVLLATCLATGCAELSSTPWPDPDSAPGLADGSAGDLGADLGGLDAPAGGSDGVLSIGSNHDVGATPPTAKWLLPADGAVVGLATPVTFTATISSPYVAPTDLFLSVTLTTGPAIAVGDLKADAAGNVTFWLDTLPPGPVGVELLVMDGANPATEVTVTVYVDSPPGAPAVAISPATPHGFDDLHATVVTAAPDVDPGEAATQTYGYQWLLNDVTTGLTTTTVSAALTEPGQAWTVRVRAWDGQAWGPPGQASVVIANSPPVPPDVKITPVNPTVADTVTCALAVAATDVDGQNLEYKYSWTLNGQPFAAAGEVPQLQLAQNGAQLLPVQAGDVLGCQVVVTDGIAIVGPTLSPPVTLAAANGCDTQPCGIHANCSPSTTIAVTCTCQDGFTGDGKICLDVNECAGDSPCALGADCTNTVGSYTCTCQSGYVQIGSGTTTTCNDIDECATAAYVCDLNADCTNTVGSYGCTCKKGWTGDGSQCVDVDQCLLGQLVCDANATCVNLPGVDTCTCDKGWTGDGLSCADVDECADVTPVCGADATCSNTPGGFDCTCSPGFSGDGTLCTDIDECADNTFVCAAEATCDNVPGTYLCKCDAGYVGDGKLCDDIDECLLGTATCNVAADCINTKGSYLCTCKPGWVGNGKSCVPE